MCRNDEIREDKIKEGDNFAKKYVAKLAPKDKQVDDIFMKSF